MATRKDHKGRVLRSGDAYIQSRDMYVYSFTDQLRVRRYRYAKDIYDRWRNLFVVLK